MAKVDLSKPIDVPTPTAVAETVDEALPMAVAAPVTAGGQLEGEFSNKDVAVPYLRIAHATSKGASDAPNMIGNFVIAEGTILGKILTVTFLRISKHYQEKTEYGDTTMPKRWNRIVDAQNSGCDFEEHGVLDMLIEVPADRTAELEDLVYATVDGKDFMAARLDVKTRGYRNTVGVLLRDKDAWLKGFFKNGKYTLSVDKRTDGKNTWFVPTIKACGPTSTELREEISTRFGL